MMKQAKMGRKLGCYGLCKIHQKLINYSDRIFHQQYRGTPAFVRVRCLSTRRSLYSEINWPEKDIIVGIQTTQKSQL